MELSSRVYDETGGKPRFRRVLSNRREEIRVPAKRGWRLLPFGSIQHLFFTFGGLATFYRVLAHPTLWNLLLFCFCLIACYAIIRDLAWMLLGEEVIRVVPGHLEIGYRLLGVERVRRYSVREISALGGGWDDLPERHAHAPFYGPLSGGAVKFETPDRTIFCAAALDEAEGAQLVEWLKRRLPVSACDWTPSPFRSL